VPPGKRQDTEAVGFLAKLKYSQLEFFRSTKCLLSFLGAQTLSRNAYGPSFSWSSVQDKSTYFF